MNGKARVILSPFEHSGCGMLPSLLFCVPTTVFLLILRDNIKNAFTPQFIQTFCMAIPASIIIGACIVGIVILFHPELMGVKKVEANNSAVANRAISSPVVRQSLPSIEDEDMTQPLALLPRPVPINWEALDLDNVPMLTDAR